MSIIIKGMDMPKEPICMVVYPVDNTSGNVVKIDTLDENRKATGAVCGHVFQLPPHGRLKDVDAILSEKGNRIVMEGDYVYHETIIQNAPTIIEAEEKDDET